MAQRLKNRHDLGCRVRIEVACGFVCEDEIRVVNERPRDRNALLLATGQFGGRVADPVGEADRFECLLA
jgi:hypothetical protein